MVFGSSAQSEVGMALTLRLGVDIYCSSSSGGGDGIGYGSVSVTGGQPGLQIQCFRLIPGKVGSIPIHFRQIYFGGSDGVGVFSLHLT